MKRLNLPTVSLLVVGLPLILVACTHLFQWTPVQDGADLDSDHMVDYEGVRIHVREFGVYDTGNAPTAEVRTHNGSLGPVAFGIDGFRLDIGGTLVPAELNQEGEFPSIYLEPGESYNTRLTFLPPPAPAGDGEPRPLPEILVLHLAPLVIDDEYHDLPTLSYRNPQR